MSSEFRLQIIGENRNGRALFVSAVPGVEIVSFKNSSQKPIENAATPVCEGCKACSMFGKVSSSGEIITKSGGSVPTDLVNQGVCKLVGTTIFVSSDTVVTNN